MGEGGREGGKRISLPHQTTSQKKRREKSPPFSLLFWVYKCGIFGGSGRRSRKIAQGIRKGDKDKEKNLVTFHTFFPCQGNGRNIAAQEREGNLVQDDGLFKGMGKEIVSRGKDFFWDNEMFELHWCSICFENKELESYLSTFTILLREN